MQNKFAIVGILLAAVLILGGIGLYFVNQERNQQEATQTSAPKMEEDNGSMKTETLVDLLKNGGTIKCTFSYKDDENTTNGTVYIDNERMRADIATTIEGVDSEISIVRKDNKNYIWGTQFPDNKGLVFESKTDEIANDKEYSDYFDFNKNIEYNCENWKVTENSFDTPNDIEFGDISGMVGGMVEEKTGQDACSACESLEGDAKNTCLETLNC